MICKTSYQNIAYIEKAPNIIPRMKVTTSYTIMFFSLISFYIFLILNVFLLILKSMFVYNIAWKLNIKNQISPIQFNRIVPINP